MEMSSDCIVAKSVYHLSLTYAEILLSFVTSSVSTHLGT